MQQDIDLCAFPARKKRDRQRPATPVLLDRYWWLREAANFDRWWSANVEMPLLREMAEKIDKEWK